MQSKENSCNFLGVSIELPIQLSLKNRQAAYPAASGVFFRMEAHNGSLAGQLLWRMRRGFSALCVGSTSIACVHK
jgi:hypothetical protein